MLPPMRAAAFLLLTILTSTALADGAFPDSNQLVALEGSKRIAVSTTFGYIVSDDDGASWFWICEEAIGPNVMQYQAGAAPDRILWAIDADLKLSRSRDGGKAWFRLSEPVLDAGFVFDVFPDPVDPQRAVATYGKQDAAGALTWQVIETNDAGASFHPIYTAPAGWKLDSVEISRSEPSVTWAIETQRDDAGWHPTLVKLWSGNDLPKVPLEDAFGRAIVRIASVDPVDPTRLYLRIQNREPGKDALGIVGDAGATLSVPLVLEGQMSSFLRRSSGELIVSSVVAGSFRSKDGITFEPWLKAPAIRALAERDGHLFVAADNFRDGFAVGRTDDDGATWTRLLRWSELCGPYPSDALDAACSLPWAILADAFQVEPAAVCPRVDPAEPPPADTACTCSGAGALTALGAIASLLSRRRR